MNDFTKDTGIIEPYTFENCDMNPVDRFQKSHNKDTIQSSKVIINNLYDTKLEQLYPKITVWEILNAKSTTLKDKKKIILYVNELMLNIKNDMLVLNLDAKIKDLFESERITDDMRPFFLELFNNANKEEMEKMKKRRTTVKINNNNNHFHKFLKCCAISFALLLPSNLNLENNKKYRLK